MFSKIIFVLATVCVVKASVITVNVFDDDPETEVASNPKDCNFRACDQLCRRLKFPGGACVNGRCKCDNFLNAEDDMTEPAEYTSPDDCKFKACAEQCFRLGFTGGACVNGRCECDNFINADDDMTDSAEYTRTSPGGCDYRACDQQCRRLGFTGGACVNGRCKCDNFLNTEVFSDAVSEFNVEDTAPVRACNNNQCNQLCRKKKFRGGACLGANCYCHKFFSLLEDDLSETSLLVSELSEDQTERGCNMRACDQLCRRLKFPGGACVNGRCKCDNFFGTEDAVDEYSEFAPRRVCRLTKCNRTCTRRGYDGATCENGRCKCYNKTQEKDASPLNDVISDENEESNVILRTNEEEPIKPSPRACNTVTCNQMCHRLNYAGGWCRFGQCQCY